MSRFSVRPQGSDGPGYSPSRDVAHMGIALMGRAIDDLDKEYWGDWLKKLSGQIGIGHDDERLGVFAQATAKFFALVPSSEAINTQDAWEKSGMRDLCLADPAAAAVMFSAIGQRFMFATFVGLRDVTLADSADYTQAASRFINNVENAISWLAVPRWKRWLARFFPRLADRFIKSQQRRLIPRFED